MGNDEGAYDTSYRTQVAKFHKQSLSGAYQQFTSACSASRFTNVQHNRPDQVQTL